MVGGGSRREESVVINSTNVFAALGSLKKKKKSKGSASEKDSEKEKEKEVFWAPAKLTKKSWADVDDDDDDDYYATTTPPEAAWTTAVESQAVKESEAEPAEEVNFVDDTLVLLVEWL